MTGNFIRNHIEHDLAQGTFAGRLWPGVPSTLVARRGASMDPLPIRTRFPPEPNGHLHIGHAKSICLNFGLAEEFGGACHLRFDDTNPTKEEQEYADAIAEMVTWMGFQYQPYLYHASEYFGILYECAVALVRADLAYVDDQTQEAIRLARGTLTLPGKDSPWRSRSVAENLDLLARMKAGEFANGSRVLRLKIDMASPNINLRDPVAYRILHSTHQRTGDIWHIYPMYDFAHGICDALENITHSLCTMEFEDHRPLYNWLNEHLAELGLLARPLPRQIEFARLNLSHTVLSKRKLIALVQDGHVSGWDDPRLPTLAGLRRRGYTSAAIRRFVRTIGVAKENSLIDQGVLEDSLRHELNPIARRAMAVLNPIPLDIINWSAGSVENLEVANHPGNEALGRRQVPFGGELWIEAEDFSAIPPKGFHRLSPGAMVRLRSAYVIRCTGHEENNGRITRVLAEYLPDSRSGTAGADHYKASAIHWVARPHAFAAQVRLLDRLFTVAEPDDNYLSQINPLAMQDYHAQLEPSLAHLAPATPVQFERHGYFVRDGQTTTAMFLQSVSLRSSWK